MKCADARERFADLLEAEPGTPPDGLLQTHLAGCAACTSEFELLRTALGEVATLQVVPAPDGFADGVMARLGTVAAPGLAAKLMMSWKGAALGVAGAAAIAIGLMQPSTAERPGSQASSAAVRPAAGGQAPASLVAETRAVETVDRAAAGRVTEDAAVVAVPPATAPESISNSIGASTPATGPAGTAPAPSLPTAAAARRGPGPGGPHTEELAHPRDGRPVDPASGEGSLDRPLAGGND